METETQKFRLGHAADGDWESLTADCLEQLGGAPLGANLGILYVTDSLADDFEPVWRRLREATGIENWVGTIGFGVCVGGREYFDRPAVTVLACTLPEDGFRILPTITRPGDSLPPELADWVVDRGPLVGVVHGDPRNAHLPAIIDALGDDFECFMVGGLTASRGGQQQLAGEITEGGLSGVLFDDSITVVSGLTQGCSPIGDIHEVTEARDNVLIQLDGRPALEVFKEDIGEVLARNMERVGGYIHAALPISGSDTGDYLVRNIMGVDPANNWLSVGERLGKGDRLMFVRRDAPSATKDLTRMLAAVAGRADAPPRAALYFSCVARGPNLFGHDSEELATVADVLGDDVPVIGFFANGEISSNRLYGYTGVLTLIM